MALADVSRRLVQAGVEACWLDLLAATSEERFFRRLERTVLSALGQLL